MQPTPNRKERLEKRDEKITNRFNELSSKKYKNKTKLYTQDAVLDMLAEEFYLSARTIENIVFGRVTYKEE